MAKKPKLGKCVHCLKHPVELDWDHVFPEAWYPKTTPPNLEKWKVPSCIPCNSALGVIEDRLLIQLAHALDIDNPASAGLYEKAKRAINPDAGKNERDQGARAASRARFLDNVLVGDAIPPHGVYPGLHDRWNQPKNDRMAVLISKEDMERVTEKIVRGITLLKGGKFIEPPYRVDVMGLPEEVSARVHELIERRGTKYALGPGIVVGRLLNPVEMTLFFEVEFFEQLKSYARVSPLL